MFRVPLLTFAAASLISTSAVHAAPTNEIGSTVVVVNRVTAEFDKDERDLKRGDRVFEDETLEVGQDAVGELMLDDDTKLALGGGSRLKLDKFVYDARKKKGDILLNLAKGAFRFVTGTADKPAYRIKTPTASITVRGTIFDLFVQEDGLTWLLLHEGAVHVCSDRGVCRFLDRPGMLLRITARGDLGPPSKWTNLPGRDAIRFDTAFPFVVRPPRIDPAPILTRDAIITGRLPDPRKPGPHRGIEQDRAAKKAMRQTDKGNSRTQKPAKHVDMEPSRYSPPQQAEVDDQPFIPPSIAIGVGVGGLGKMKDRDGRSRKPRHDFSDGPVRGGKYRPPQGAPSMDGPLKGAGRKSYLPTVSQTPLAGPGARTGDKVRRPRGGTTMDGTAKGSTGKYQKPIISPSPFASGTGKGGGKYRQPIITPSPFLGGAKKVPLR